MGNRKRIEGIAFDWAGTLTPWHTIDIPDTWLQVAKAIDGDEAPAIADRLLRAERELLTRCREQHVSGTLDQVFQAAGVASGPEVLDAYRLAWEEHTFLDPAGVRVLRALRERGLTIGVLSNTLWPAAWHREIFERDGALELIDAAVYSSEVPWTKPHPRIFASMTSAMGLADPASCAFVGDRLFEDIYGAREAGMPTIWVPHSVIPEEEMGSGTAQPDATVVGLEQLVELVDAWNNA